MNLLRFCVLAFVFLSFNSLAEDVAATSKNLKQTQSETKTFASLDVIVDIDGGKNSELAENLKKEIALSHLKNDEFPAQTDFLYNRAKQTIQDVLRAMGYYSPVITSQLERQPKTTRATFKIHLGKPVKIRTIDLKISGDGHDLPRWNQFRKFQLSLKPNAIFTHQNYTDTVTAITNIAVNEGYMDYQFTQREFKVYPHLHAVDIHIHLDTQKSYQFGKVTFIGNQQINDDFLRRYIDFAPGEQFQQSKILDLQKALIDSQYFGLIRVSPQYSKQTDRRIPVEVELEDNLKHRYEMGLGYGTDTGARVLFGFENRLVNQHGHNYQVDSLFGENAQNVTFNYRIPGSRPAVQHWNMGLKYDATQSDTLNRALTALSADYNYQINPEWLINPFVSLETESFRYTNDPSEITQTLLLGAGIKNRWVNNESYPTDGYHHNATLRVSIDNIVSDSQFAQLELSGRRIFSIMDVWRLHARLQTTLTLADKTQTIPASYLSLLGGENLRGYEFESIGIQSDADSIIGARNSVSASLETDYRLTEYLGLGLFSDAGQLFDDQQTGDLKIGAGIGLRGYTPVGMAKLDVAWPVSEKVQPWRIHFSLGFDL
jgi:translocation and assembly module TamA